MLGKGDDERQAFPNFCSKVRVIAVRLTLSPTIYIVGVLFGNNSERRASVPEVLLPRYFYELSEQ